MTTLQEEFEAYDQRVRNPTPEQRQNDINGINPDGSPSFAALYRAQARGDIPTLPVVLRIEDLTREQQRAFAQSVIDNEKGETDDRT